jgi:hypothetical protein
MSVSASISDSISKFLQIAHLTNLTNNTFNPSSLSNMVKQTNVEPFCVISKDCVNLEYITDVNSTLLNMFSAYYLQAISTITRLSDVRIKKVLNAVGTNTQFSLESVSLNADVLKFKLPNSTNLSLESELTDKFKGILNKVPVHNGKDYPNAKTGLSENSQEYYNTANLAIGKIIEVTITLDGGVRTFIKTKTSTTNDNGNSNYFEGNNIVPDNTTVTERESTTKGTEQQIVKNDDVLVTIPIHVRLLVNVVGPKTIDSLLVRHKEDIGFDERWYSWRSGRISFWKDLVLCQDLIRERKRQALDSDGDVVSKIDARVRNAIVNKVAKMSFKTLGGQASEIKDVDTMSFGVASNLYVITAAEASRIEYHLHGKLSDTKTRNKLFGNGYAMILAVIDPDRERVKFYINGVDGFTDLSVREIKSMSKNKGPDINDMLKMLQMGMSPTF